MTKGVGLVFSYPSFDPAISKLNFTDVVAKGKTASYGYLDRDLIADSSDAVLNFTQPFYNKQNVLVGVVIIQYDAQDIIENIVNSRLTSSFYYN